MTKVVISWSGNQSRFVASKLQELIKLTCTAAEPWVSNNDLAAGTVWTFELIKQLQSTHFGVICIDINNLNSPWLHFEAGALAKSLDSSAVFPYLIDCPASAISGPLTLFQSVSADKDGTFKLIAALNRILRDKQEPSQSDSGLQTLFEKLWPDYHRELERAPKVPLDAGPERSDSEILAELLKTARQQSRLLFSILRAGPTYRPPIQTAEQPPVIVSRDDYLNLSFEELRSDAMNLRKSGHFTAALDLFQKALALQPGDLETLIDIAVTETYLPNSAYEESINKLQELVRERATREQSPQPEESILAKAYYNLACIKHIARREQGRPCMDEEIFADLEYAYMRYPAYVNTALVDHDLAQLRKHPRFRELVEKYRRAER
jgi:tetratricopeptide (TPR) repeat protein